MSLIWQAGGVLSSLLCPFDVSAYEHFLTFGDRISQVPPVLSLPQSWTQPFLQGTLSLFSQESYLEAQSA